MNAAKRYQSNWEELNEQRLRLLWQSSFKFFITSYKLTSALVNVAVFIAFKAIKIAKYLLTATALSHPIVKVEREEAWLYRQIK